MEFQDYYAALGVNKGASQDEVKRAYRRLARKFHPDVNPGDLDAERRFKELNEANEVLGDPETRRKYDELGANWRMYGQAGSSGFPGAARGGRTMSPEEAEAMFGGHGGVSDFFATFFTGGGAARRGQETTSPRGKTRPGSWHHGPGRGQGTSNSGRGRDVEYQLSLSLEEAFSGTTRQLLLEGAGQTKTVEVKIPAGVGEGSRVRVAGEGEADRYGAPAGDLYLIVNLVPHATFTRKRQDLHVDIAIPVTTAVLGGEVAVPRLAGDPLGLKVPAGTQNGQVFRLKGHGVPGLGATRAEGDLYAKVSVRVPSELTSLEREHYEALAALDRG